MIEGIAGGQSGALIINETLFAIGGNDGFYYCLNNFLKGVFKLLLLMDQLLRSEIARLVIVLKLFSSLIWH